MENSFGINDGEVVVVTGAAGTMGKALVEKLLDMGIKVAAHARSKSGLDKAFADRDNLIKIGFDLSDIEQVKTFLPVVAKEYGKIRGLVHFAGVDKMLPIQLIDSKTLRELMYIHAEVPYVMIGSLMKRDVFAEGCSVVCISSLATKEGAVGHTAYAMAKGALTGFLASAAAELSNRKIRLNLVTPGVVSGEMSQAWISKLSEEQKAALNQSYPFGLGTGEDIANAVVFLLGNESKWMTGQEMILDGGHLCKKA